MDTLILQQPGEFVFTQSEAPAEPAPHEAIVRVRRIGICGTDIHAFLGHQPFLRYPRILGHELGVEVVQVGAETRGVRVGDRCAVRPYLHCGRCVACRRGKTNCCVRLEVLGVHMDGGMREYMAVPADNLHRSEKLSLDQLALVETLCIGAHSVGRSGLAAGDVVLVIGAGPIGLAVTTFALLAGATVLVADISTARLAFCRERLGVAHTLDASTDLLLPLEEITSGDLPTTVFDATGNAASMIKAFDYVAHGGTLVMVGLVQADICFPDPLLHRKELSVLSSRNATAADFERVLRLFEEGKIDVAPWITHRAGLRALPDVFAGWLAPGSGVVKAVVEA
ncbi:MAG TPA: zinc-binding alcohol dehydrogenase family protein [Chthonomonadales bacterium]|nr:zinc-binding alcohol dehydrogenase family protein [Chthonomonadales bacterium]